MAYEGAREREVHRFYQPWLETFHAISLPVEIEKNHKIPREDGHVPQSSQDRALTAFTQLGALRLNAQRCVVALIDNKFQYVLAEATKSLSLMDDARHDAGDELWLGNSRIPRGQGVSEDALYPEDYVARNAKGEEFRSPALVINDLATHPRYKDKKYAGAGGINFYAGVPIVTNRGHTIGVYTVVDNQPHDGLSVEELHSMVDMAAIVLQHLEGIRNERARARGERLIQGIGTFIEGDLIDATLSIESPGPNHVIDPLDAAGRRQQRPKLSRSRESSGNFKGLTIVDANSAAREQYSSQEDESIKSAAHKRIRPPVRKDPIESPGDPYKAKQKVKSQHVMVFDRAARIMRKCLGADGVAFMDASSANLSKGTARKEIDNDNSTSVQHTQKKKGSTKPKPQSAVTPEEDGETPGVTHRSNPMDQSIETKQLCEVIALTMRDLHADVSMDVTEHDLRKLVRRYPQGKAYTFDADGNLATSDDSASEGVIHKDGQNGDGVDNIDGRIKRKGPKKNALHVALPKARTIVFLPLWDFANQRWNAAAVIWSSHPTKMMNVAQDFSYLRAFANSVMNEIARLNLSVSDAAKATFLANISHELRSPLHGILGSIEFLHDTALDDFQSGMVISVETCGKTLLDTVNHVLDFAKLNNLSKQTNGSRKGSKSASSSTHTPITSTFDLAVVVEEGVEAVYAGQVFRTASQDAVEGQGPSLSSSDKAMATRQNNKHQIALGQALNADSVALTLHIDEGIDWHVTSQPGAVRRIVMNLLGNALKYTPEGSINVSLEIDTARTHEREVGLLHACITVSDTGKGMSDDFVRNHAFTAFSQEDSLATGTGLGLSIIRSIVDSLGGEIDLRSQKDLGTEVKIWLSLPSADDHSGLLLERNILHQVAQRTAGMSLCLLSPPMPNQGKENVVSGLREMPTVEDSLRNLLSQWYSLNVFTAPSMEKVENANFFVYAEPPEMEHLLHQHGRHAGDKEVPVIVFCQNAFRASSLRANGIHHLTEIGRIIEVIAQPIGPQKLARVLHRCLQRSKMLENSSEALSSEHVTLSLHSSDPSNGSAGRNTRAPASDATLLPPGKDSRRSSFSPEKLKRPQPDRAKSESFTAKRPSPSHRPEASPHQPQQSLQQNPQPNVETSLPSVLAVDDNQINLQLMETFVRKTRHPYEAATDGALALEAYKKSAVDPKTGKVDKDTPRRFKYILMDINMPNMDGSTATKEIRKFEKENKLAPPVKIFALTGLGDLEQPWTKEVGFDRVLSKPIKFKELNELLV